ncbi:MAG: TetR/AcrR family transcriptional regulator [Lysobacterales bacterium]
MSKTLKAEEANLAGTRVGNRRELILEAFHACMISQGYSNTSLRDVARKAGMSASHLLYYFSGKDAILEHCFEVVSRRIRDRIGSFRSESPARQVDLLADLFFAGKGITNSETGFMLECFGVAIHDQRLHEEKSSLDRFCKDYLKALFAGGGCRHTEARDHAEVAYALLIGLRTAAYFDGRLDLKQARALFHADVIKKFPV